MAALCIPRAPCVERRRRRVVAMPGEGGSTVEHYDALGDQYNKAWFYEDGTEYQHWLLAQTKARLHVEDKETCQVVDLGAGTGNFSLALHDLCGLSLPLLCVDPSEPLLKQAQAAAPKLSTCLSDGLSFAAREDMTYDRILMKEVIHHFSPSDLPALFTGIYRQLRPGGRLLIVSRPHDSSHYPFPACAHRTWSAAQLADSYYTTTLHQHTPFTTITTDTADFNVEIPAGRWFSMIRSRFWSNFADFGDGDLARGVEEVRAKLGGVSDEEVITFPDRILFITAEKARE